MSLSTSTIKRIGLHFQQMASTAKSQESNKERCLKYEVLHDKKTKYVETITRVQTF